MSEWHHLRSIIVTSNDEIKIYLPTFEIYRRAIQIEQEAQPSLR